MTIAPIEAVTSAEITTLQPLSPTLGAARAGSFSNLLLGGVDQVNQKLIDAEATATAFVTDDSIPLHQVTYALEQARMSFELMMQVRNRLTEAYQEIMRMQL
jgi:flagellar hook-basal body complex protein FliE